MITKTSIRPTWLTHQLLSGMLRGIEKEGLRIQADGYLSKTLHPTLLGSKLTHPHITTDYSENLLELITDPKPTVKDALQQLQDLHVLIYQAMNDEELLWSLSMPFLLSASDEDIPLANYGTSNIGKLKTLYRHALGVRYGRRMQTIAGLHYNISFGDELFIEWQQQLGNEEGLQDFKNKKYLGLIRNFKRLTSLILYFFGASPSVSACFVEGLDHQLRALSSTDASSTTLYQPCATSLRMSKLGYTNSVQENLDIRYNTLSEYTTGLKQAIRTPFNEFSQIGVDDEQGNPIQINDHILQIENEYYSPIRPKQVAKTDETPTEALEDRGIAYVEFRAIDLDPYSDIGISVASACFLEMIALYCLINNSAELLPDEEKELAINLDRVVNHGRQTDIQILVNGDEQCLHNWMQQHLVNIAPLAQLFDEQYGSDDYCNALAVMHNKIHHPELTLSAQMMADTKQLGGMWQLGHQLATQHKTTLTGTVLHSQADYNAIAQNSVLQQTKLEQQTEQDFSDYIKQFR